MPRKLRPRKKVPQKAALRLSPTRSSSSSSCHSLPPMSTHNPLEQRKPTGTKKQLPPRHSFIGLPLRKERKNLLDLIQPRMGQDDEPGPSALEPPLRPRQRGGTEKGKTKMGQETATGPSLLTQVRKKGKSVASCLSEEMLPELVPSKKKQTQASPGASSLVQSLNAPGLSSLTDNQPKQRIKCVNRECTNEAKEDLPGCGGEFCSRKKMPRKLRPRKKVPQKAALRLSPTRSSSSSSCHSLPPMSTHNPLEQRMPTGTKKQLPPRHSFIGLPLRKERKNLLDLIQPRMGQDDEPGPSALEPPLRRRQRGGTEKGKTKMGQETATGPSLLTQVRKKGKSVASCLSEEMLLDLVPSKKKQAQALPGASSLVQSLNAPGLSSLTDNQPKQRIKCVNRKCTNEAKEDVPGCDGEYCSFECVMAHCKDAFTTFQLKNLLES